MNGRRILTALVLFVAYGCATTPPAPPPITETMNGVASWYGEEFAGRTTANGEIFDPMLLTAAHRTLPFGTVVDVKNPKTGQVVRVRINDRGPYVGNRVIDLSYAAAQQISLIDPGSGDVEIHVVKMGSGEREPPAPYDVTVVPPPKEKMVIASAEPPKIDFPLPAETKKTPEPQKPVEPAVPDVPVIVENVQVQEQHGTTETRRQVAANGRTIETVPVAPAATPTAPPPAEKPAASRPAPPKHTGQFVVQVGAFSIEANAKALVSKLEEIGQKPFVAHDNLYRVRLGPFPTRDAAIQARTALEAKGISAIVIAE